MSKVKDKGSETICKSLVKKAKSRVKNIVPYTKRKIEEQKEIIAIVNRKIRNTDKELFPVESYKDYIIDLHFLGVRAAEKIEEYKEKYPEFFI